MVEHGVKSDAFLFHRVTLPDGHRLILKGVEVNRDAEWRADLVLPPVTPSDGTRIIEVDIPSLAQASPPGLAPSGERSSIT